MNVREAKVMCKSGATEELLRLYRQMKAQQRGMSLSALTASCRVTDKLGAELRRRGAL